MAKVIKKKVVAPVVEEKVVPPVEEKKTAKATKPPVEKPVKEEPKKVAEPVEIYPAKIPTKNGQCVYNRIDDISYADLVKTVSEKGKDYPYRILLRENGVMTQLAVVFVGRWLVAIDITSKDDEKRESIFRYSEAEFMQRESGGFKFALYEKVETPAVTPSPKPKVEKAEEPEEEKPKRKPAVKK